MVHHRCLVLPLLGLYYLPNRAIVYSAYSISKRYVLLSAKQYTTQLAATGKVVYCFAYTLPMHASAATSEVLGTLAHAQLNPYYYNNLHYAPFTGIGSGIASSLPSLVLRSMLKQRRILMRMH